MFDKILKIHIVDRSTTEKITGIEFTCWSNVLNAEIILGMEVPFSTDAIKNMYFGDVMKALGAHQYYISTWRGAPNEETILHSSKKRSSSNRLSNTNARLSERTRNDPLSDQSGIKETSEGS